MQRAGRVVQAEDEGFVISFDLVHRVIVDVVSAAVEERSERNRGHTRRREHGDVLQIGSEREDLSGPGLAAIGDDAFEVDDEGVAPQPAA